MAAITSAASGNWSATGTWTGGVVPTSADDVTIQAAHTVTLDVTTAVARTVTINGTFQNNTGVSTKLATQLGWFISTTGIVNFDVSGNVAVLCDVVTNVATTGSGPSANVEANSNGQYTFKGFPRKRKTTLVSGIAAAATSATVADVTGWQVGDKIVFATTQAYNATPRTDEITILTVNTGTGAITWTGGIAYAHAAGGYVGNFSSNMTFAPGTAGSDGGSISQQISYDTNRRVKLVQNVLFKSSLNNDYRRAGAIGCGDSGSSYCADQKFDILDNAFYDCRLRMLYLYGTGGPFNIARCVYYATLDYEYSGALFMDGMDFGPIDDVHIFRSRQSGFNGGNLSVGVDIKNSSASACKYGIELRGSAWSVVDFECYSNQIGLQYFNFSGELLRLNNGTFNSGAATNGGCDGYSQAATIINHQDNKTQTLALNGIASALRQTKSVFTNKNQDVTQQEIYTPIMWVKRDNANTQRSTSSIAIYPTKISTNCQRTLSIACAAGASVRVVGYVKKSHATNIAATVAITGLGSSASPFTKANDTAWEKYDLTATNSSGVDGNFTLTYTANSSSGTTNVAYFDGVPDSPFVTKCRHYGFTFDESNPVRAVNPVSLVSEATAAAYTGVTVTASQITVGAGTANTWREVYDYVQAYYCANTASTVNLTSTDGNNFALPQTYKLSWPGMGNDGTLAGGWLLLPSAGAYTHKLSGTKVDFTAAGTYDLSNCQFSGSVEFVNSSGGAVTVSIPSGFTPVNTGPNITLSAPVISTTVAAQVSLAGAEIRVYDLDNSPAGSLGTELAGTESCPGSTFSFTVAAGNNVWVQIMLAGYKEYGQQITGPAASTTFTVALTKELDA